MEGTEHTIRLPEKKKKKRLLVCIFMHMWENGMVENCRALHTLLSKQRHLGAASAPPTPPILSNPLPYLCIPITPKDT